MDQSDPSSSTSGHGWTAPTAPAPAGVRSKGTPAIGEFRLQPDFNWTRSLSERVRGMRDSALGVVWKKRREQKLREIEARDACCWLMAAGFPQYVQLYEEHLCPINEDQVMVDHSQLNDDYMPAVMRRISVLNRMATLKADAYVRIKATESEDCDRLIALSDSWVIRPSGGGRRWTHRELSDDRVATVPVHVDADNSNHHHHHHHHHHRSSSRQRRARGDDSKDSSTSEASPVVGGGSSRTSPVVVSKDSSSCGEMPSQRDALDVTEFSRGSADRFSLRGARNALRRGVDSLIGRRTSSSAVSRRHHQQQVNGTGRLDIGDPVPVSSEALQRTMDRLGCVDLLTVDRLDGGVRRPRSSDSLLPSHREVSPSRLSVQLDSERATPERVETSSAIVAPSSDEWTKYFQSCFCDLFEDAPAPLPTVVTTCFDESLNVGRQTELDQILDEIVRDIDLLDQTLADSVEQRSTHSEERTSASPGGLDDDDWQFQLDIDRCDVAAGGRRSELAPVTLTTMNGGGGGSERRDSGVGFSLTRPTRRSGAWHGCDDDIRELNCNHDDDDANFRQLSHMTASQLIALRKLCLLQLTSVMETYSPLHQTGSNWSLPRPNFDGDAGGPSRRRRVFGAALGWSTCRLLPLPCCIVDAMNCLIRSAPEAVGIFRKSGVRSRIQKLRDDIEADPEYNGKELENMPVYDVADMLKLYFHELPDCLLTERLSETCCSIFTHVPSEYRKAALQSVVALLPDEHRQALHCLLLFLNRLADYAAENQMTASNLAICFAPSLFHVYGLRSGSSLAAGNGTASTALGRSSPRRDGKHANVGGLLDENELIEQKAALDCLTFMIVNVNDLFTISDELFVVHRMLCSRLDDRQQQQPSTDVSFVDGHLSNYQTLVNSCIDSVIKDAQEPSCSRTWLPVRLTHDDAVELSFRATAQLPTRLWRCRTDVEDTRPGDLLAAVVRERHVWDETVSRCRVVERLDDNSDTFHYVLASPAISTSSSSSSSPSSLPPPAAACVSLPRPPVNMCELRSWRTDLDGGTCVMVSVSVECPNVKCVTGCVRGQTLASHFCLEPRGSTGCRLTYFSQADLRGHGAEWYRKFYGHVVAHRVARIRQLLSARSGATQSTNTSS